MPLEPVPDLSADCLCCFTTGDYDYVDSGGKNAETAQVHRQLKTKLMTPAFVAVELVEGGGDKPRRCDNGQVVPGLESREWDARFKLRAGDRFKHLRNCLLRYRP